MSMRAAGLRYDRPAPQPTPIPSLLSRAGIDISWPVLLVGELAREWEPVLPGILWIESWLQTPGRPQVMGAAGDLPLRSAVTRSAVLDHALSLHCIPRRVLAEAARVACPGARLLIRERNWRWEMAGERRTVLTGFRSYDGKLFFGEVERTLDPPLEVERVWLLDRSVAEVSRMLKLPRDRLAALTLSDFPEVTYHFVREEKFSIVQFVDASLEALVREAGLRVAAWLERNGAYLTLAAEKTALREKGQPV